MSDLAVQAQSVAELSRFAEPARREPSVREKAEAEAPTRERPSSDTADGVGLRVDTRI